MKKSVGKRITIVIVAFMCCLLIGGACLWGIGGFSKQSSNSNSNLDIRNNAVYSEFEAEGKLLTDSDNFIHIGQSYTIQKIASIVNNREIYPKITMDKIQIGTSMYDSYEIFAKIVPRACLTKVGTYFYMGEDFGYYVETKYASIGAVSIYSQVLVIDYDMVIPNQKLKYKMYSNIRPLMQINLRMDEKYPKNNFTINIGEEHGIAKKFFMSNISNVINVSHICDINCTNIPSSSVQCKEQYDSGYDINKDNNPILRSLNYSFNGRYADNTINWGSIEHATTKDALVMILSNVKKIGGTIGNIIAAAEMLNNFVAGVNASVPWQNVSYDAESYIKEFSDIYYCRANGVPFTRNADIELENPRLMFIPNYYVDSEGNVFGDNIRTIIHLDNSNGNTLTSIITTFNIGYYYGENTSKTYPVIESNCENKDGVKLGSFSVLQNINTNQKPMPDYNGEGYECKSCGSTNTYPIAPYTYKCRYCNYTFYRQ